MKDSKQQIYDAVRKKAVSLMRQGQSWNEEQLTRWIANKYPRFQHPFGTRAVIQAAYLLSKERGNQEAMRALLSVFTHGNGAPLWWEKNNK